MKHNCSVSMKCLHKKIWKEGKFWDSQNNMFEFIINDHINTFVIQEHTFLFWESHRLLLLY